MTEKELYTTGEIADILGEPPTRVQYIIAKHRLKPVQRIGIFRLFSKEQVEAIKQALYGIQIRGDK
jgi:DNA-binding transcriptional MerR regulator